MSDESCPITNYLLKMTDGDPRTSPDLEPLYARNFEVTTDNDLRINSTVPGEFKLFLVA